MLQALSLPFAKRGVVDYGIFELWFHITLSVDLKGKNVAPHTTKK